MTLAFRMLLGTVRCGAAVGLLCASMIASAHAQTATAGDVLRGRFAQERFLQGFRAPLRSEGTFLLQPGHGLIWRAERPFSVLTVVTPAGLVQSTGGTETLRLPSSRMPAMAHLFALLDAALAGDWTGIGQQFALARKGDAAGWEIVLTPLPSAGIEALTLKEARLRGARFVASVEIERQGGDMDRLVFSDHQLSRGPLSPEEAKLMDDAARP